MHTEHAIKTEQVGRIYKIRHTKKGQPSERVALAGVDLAVPRGEFFGLLGPNGAGKSTLIKILTTLLAPSSGRALVAGFDVARQPQEVRPRISLVAGGENTGYGLLTVRETLWMFSQFYGLDTKVAYARIDALLEIVGLSDRAHTKISDLSTGLRQKMNIVRGFVTDPEVVFLDEPTLGLDVGASRDIRQFVREWMADKPGRTVLLTTHYMAEADELCDRLAIIDRGRLLAVDTPEALKHRLQREAIFHLKVQPLGARPSKDQMIEAVPGVRQVNLVEHNDYTGLTLILEAEDVLANVLAHLTGRGSSLISLEKREPTLEDVFIDLVGRGLDVDTSHRAGEDDG
jgi:ABC-2 type transport system ATP-binding protein